MDRPRFTPSPCDVQSLAIPALTSVSPDEIWLPLVACPANFPLNLFERAVEQLVHHPEYNSTLILRSETVSETLHDTNETLPSHLKSHRPVYNIHRKLLPRRPGRDASLEQRCTLYASTNDTFGGAPSTLVLTPLLPPGATLPYYHPPVRHLAFRFIPSTPPILRIEGVVLPDTPLDLNSRLYRTSLALLETLHRYGWGAMTHYRKRVKHDCVIPREAYQDLYLVMRERYKHLVSEWKESTDPLKHVFEDIGIATYLMLLWKQSFADTEHRSDGNVSPHCMAWKDWPQPPGGFLDLGCGNGLLTHILISEGYRGHGIDLRARTSWDHYSECTRTALHVHALDPTQYLRTITEKPVVIPYLQSGAFLIGNHADELTPWIPLIATIEQASGYLSIPCCAWSFDERFARGSTGTTFVDLPDMVDNDAFMDSLNLGGEGGHQSQYSKYRIWLAKLSRWMGWKVECDTLRIPSTRNWAIMGRERLNEDDQVYVERALGIVQDVLKRGAFKTRTPEGKAGEH